MPNTRTMPAAGLLVLLAAVCSACTAPTTDDLPAYGSLDEAREAVSGQLDCLEDPPESTDVMGSDGRIPTESVKCTSTVEIFYFDSQDARDATYDLMAGSAEGDGSVYFAEGRNWFVVDYSEVGVGDTDPDPLDLSVLSEPLGTRFTEVD